MSLLTDVAVALLAGTVSYLVLGLLIGFVPKRSVRQAVGQHFMGEALLLLGRALLIKRRHGGLTLRGARYDGGVPSEQVRLGGQELDFRDEVNGMTRFMGIPFGLAHEATEQIVTPFDMDLGAARRNAIRTGKLSSSTGPRPEDKAWLGVLDWEPRTPAIVDPDGVLWCLQGSAPPTAVDSGRTLIQIAKEAFNSERFADDMKVLIAFGAGFGAMFLSSRVVESVGGGGGVGSTIPIMIGLAVIPAGPSLSEVLRRLGTESYQRGLRDVAQLMIGLGAGVYVVHAKAEKLVCNGIFYPDTHGCAQLQGFVNDLSVVVVLALLVSVGGILAGTLYEPGDEPAADAEVSD